MSLFSESTKYITDYVMHDPLGNVEGIITDYDTEHLKKAQDAGMVIIAEYNDGSREIVKAEDVSEPRGNDFEVVLPPYVDKRTDLIAECLDAVSAIIDPEVATTSVDGASEQSDPIAAFKTALGKLHELIEED